MVVGIPNDDRTSGIDSGAATVFLRNGFTWDLSSATMLIPSDPHASAFFGDAVDISRDATNIIVGADYRTGAGFGRVYVFVREDYYDEVFWLEQQCLQAPTGNSGVLDLFGAAVSLDSMLAVGAPGHTVASMGVSNSGAVYVFRKDDSVLGSWMATPEAYLYPNDALGLDNFGCSVDIVGDLLLVGSYTHNNYRGAAYLYQRQGPGTWVLQTKLVSLDAQPYDRLGSSVRLSNSGSFAILAAVNVDTVYGTNTGMVYVYSRNGTTSS